MKFSIITPSYNQAKWIPETLESVRRQTDEGGFSIEHWVMDGASTDGTVAVLNEWKIQADRMEDGSKPENYSFGFFSEPDRGQSQAINKGLEKSTGDILSYLCSDDLLEPGALARVGEIFKNHPEVEVVYGDYFFLEGDSGWKRPKKARDFTLEGLRKHNFISQPATFWRRGVYERFGGFDENLRYCMDHEYWLRIAADVKWYYLKRPLASMRLHAEAKTSASLGEAWKETYRMVGRYGLGPQFFWKAVWMNCGGQWFYQGKRLLLREMGKKRGTLG